MRVIDIEQCHYEPQIFTWGKEVHEYCKRNCGESKVRTRDGDRFIVCGQANDEICISLRKCPLDKWVAGEGFHILPMDEPQGEWIVENGKGGYNGSKVTTDIR